MSESTPVLSDYQRGMRRMLVDMEIPAWDDRFLSQYDPIAMADLYVRAGAESVMFACKNLSGWCFWPTSVGEMHPRLNGRDVVAETVEALAERGIAACAYYAAIYDNWPFERHPDWRVQPAAGWERSMNGTARDRHGLCCPNNQQYREFLSAQIADLFGRYEFGCAFCDMSFWPTVCVCESCQRRFAEENGGAIPDTVDWTSADWCAFQGARDRWIDEFHGFVSGSIRDASPGIAVYHNFATGPGHWLRGVPFSVTRHSDFLGGDLYGDSVEQLLVMKFMNGLSQSRPVEFMTFATTHAYEHVRLKSRERLRTQVLTATAEDTAFMYIEAIDPIGTAADAHYDLIHDAFEAGRSLTPRSVPSSTPIADVAIYFSSESRVDFAENGRSVVEVTTQVGAAPTPHVAALRGACRILQRAHVPFGVVTRFDLESLERYPVVVLPNVLRMDADEVAAFRRYVAGGGRLYASRYTSIVETNGTLHDDFMLADVFGANVVREEPATFVYARPATAVAVGWFSPQRYLTADPRTGSLRGGLLRLRAEPGVDVLATLTLPFAHPQSGDAFQQNWASIHTSPPWEDTDEPTIVEHAFGQGRAIYSSLDIERDDADANDRLFASLIVRLLAEQWTVECDTDPHISLSAFADTTVGGVRVALLNSPQRAVPGAALRVRPPDGTVVTAVEQVGAEQPVAFEVQADGAVSMSLNDLGELEVVHVRCGRP
jgi:hypothetical protein